VFNLQGSEIIVILLVALVVLGPEKLPDAVRRASRTYHELRKMGTGFQSELKAALDEPMREMRETADLVREAADPNRVAVEQPTPTQPPGERRSPEPAPDAAPDPAPVAADDEVLGEMWEDESFYRGSSGAGSDATDEDLQ
jgi:sec-independent protein translocase protein TatB